MEDFSQPELSRPTQLWFLIHCSTGKWGRGSPFPPQAPFLLENRTRSWRRGGAKEGCGVSSSSPTPEEDSQMDGWKGAWASEVPGAARGWQGIAEGLRPGGPVISGVMGWLLQSWTRWLETWLEGQCWGGGGVLQETFVLNMRRGGYGERRGGWGDRKSI